MDTAIEVPTAPERDAPVRTPDWARVMRAARRFGISSEDGQLRPGQRELVEAVLAGRDAIGVLPTGGGKSLCHQLPALFLRQPTVVISPLLALVQDQVAHLDRFRMESSRLDSSLSAAEAPHLGDNEEEIRTGISPLIYVTPERLQTEDCIALLRRNGVARLVVDEAHCVSDWGHDFRPAYLGIAEVARRLGRPPILATTATATAETAADIAIQLGMRAPLIVRPGLTRKNLVFRVLRTVNEGRKREALRAILAQEPGVGIVYVATTALADEIHAWLTEFGVAAGLYHGKRPMHEREQTQVAFMENAYRVMVATKAFGLGPSRLGDKPDVRFVVHWTFPDSLETYAQEAGRAGRDGEPARAYLFYRLEDRRIQAYFLSGKYPRAVECQRLCAILSNVTRPHVTLAALAAEAAMPVRRLEVVLAHLSRDGVVRMRDERLTIVAPAEARRRLAAVVASYERRRVGDKARLAAMMHYAQSVACRAAHILGYFGELAEPCGRCDVCVARGAS